MAHALVKVAGDHQTAPPGAAVAAAPVVHVEDNLGAPMAAVDVRFTVSPGGGSVEHQTARTDADGRASPGAWTLGPASGLHTLSASVAGLAPVEFAAKAARVAADVQLSVLLPSQGRTVGEAVRVIARVWSTYQLASVAASAAGHVVLLAYEPLVTGQHVVSGPAWDGVLALSGVPRGDVVLVVTATDVFANSTDVVLPVVLDRAPAVAVSAPLESTLARPRVRIVATCGDDDPAGCVSLSATVDATVLARGKDFLSQEVDLSAYEGRGVSLAITGVDSAGQATTVTRTLFVDTSAQLSVLAEVGGPVWDVSGSRVLYLETSAATPSLKVLDIATGSTQTVETGTDLVVTSYGLLTPAGALYVHGVADSPTSPYAWLYEWRDGGVTNLGGLNSAQSLRVAGRWALYSTGAELWRRDLGNGQSALLTSNAGNWRNDVAANGDVAYWSRDYNIVRWRGGSAAALTNDVPATQWNTYPLTDGTIVVYRKHSPCCPATAYRIALHDGSKETVLTAASTTEPYPGRSYAVAGGHVAYAVEDFAGVLQIWRHGPGGAQQLTFFGTSSTIDAIAEDGTVVLTQKDKRYLAPVGSPLAPIGPAIGRVIVRNGRFLVLIERTVLELRP